MIRELKKNEINKFVNFGDSLYKADSNYPPFIRSDLKKTIRKLVFVKKRYRALCSFDGTGAMNGRVLLTVKKNKQLNTDYCGCFSHFEVVNSQAVFNELMDGATDLLRQMGAEYIMGSFFPHDPDNRRGILVEGFEHSPVIFTSHNPPYYKTLFETYGFEKLTDALEYEYKEDEQTLERIKTIAEKAVAENDIRIEKVNLKQLDREVADIQKIMEIASTQINFEKVLSFEEMKKIVKGMKAFINPDFVFIARRNTDNLPVGFTMSIPDYYEIIRKIHGRMNLYGLLVFLRDRKKINTIRGMLQYIIPEYQHKGISKALYYETKKAVDANGIKRICLGTIMEKNGSSNGSMQSIGGHLSRVYRIYFKKI